MSHKENESKISIFKSEELIYEIDSENPDISKLIEKIVIDKDITNDNIHCETKIEKFDVESFTELIKQTVTEVRDSLVSEIKDYEEINKTIVLDDDVKEYYSRLISE